MTVTGICKKKLSSGETEFQIIAYLKIYQNVRLLFWKEEFGSLTRLSGAKLCYILQTYKKLHLLLRQNF